MRISSATFNLLCLNFLKSLSCRAMLSRTPPSNHSCELLLAHLVLKGANLSVTLRPKKKKLLFLEMRVTKKIFTRVAAKHFFVTLTEFFKESLHLKITLTVPFC